MYTLLAQQTRDPEGNNNKSEEEEEDNNNKNSGVFKNEYKGSADDDNDNEIVQEPLLDARMGREHKRKRPWHLFLFVSLVKIPSAWQMASILFIAPDKLSGTYWCKTGQLIQEDGYQDPCSAYVTANEMVTGVPNITVTETNSLSGNYYSTLNQDSMSDPCGRLFDISSMSATMHTGYSENNKTLNSEQFEVYSDYFNITDQATESSPCHSQIKYNETMDSVSETSGRKSVPCQQFEFSEGYYSIIDQWQLVCGRKILVSVSQFFYLAGVLAGGILYTYLVQMWPPRPILIGGLIVQIISGTGVAVSPYFPLHCALRFITAAACTQMFTAGYNICTGLMEGKAKTVAGCCYEHLWSVGVITLPCLASLFSDWRHLQLAISLPTAIILLCSRYIPECPDWKPRKRVRKKKQISSDDGVAKMDNTTKEINGNVGHSVQKIKASHQTLHEESSHKVKYIGIHGVWLFTVVTYYGGLLNVKNLGPELFLNVVTAGAAEIVGVLTGLIILLWKSSVWSSLAMINIAGGLSCLLSWALPKDLGDWYPQLLLLAMLGRIAIACCLTILTLASANQFPPARKFQGMFTCVSFSRVYLLQAPFVGTLAMYGERVSLSVFGLYTLLAGIFALTQTAKTEERDCARVKGNYELEIAARQMKEEAFREV